MTREEILKAISEKADLRGADLSGADLSGADLSGADLNGADLYKADLHGANLYKANLSGANLRGANLHGADLSGAYLREANLYTAYLSGANLYTAYLSGANLRGANLSGAYLSGAHLREADLSGADLVYNILPEGEITVWKKLSEGVICELLIPKDAKRVCSPIGRKCRADKAFVVSLSAGDFASSKYDSSFIYTIGKWVKADLDEDIRYECGTGIHFFITKAEAESY